MSDLTPEEKGLLHNERLIQKILEIRGLVPKEPATPHPFVAFLQSGAGTALITVVLGGIIGGIITTKFQEREKEREIRATALNELGKEQQVKLGDAFALTAKAVAAAEDLGTLTTKPFYIGPDDGLTKDQKAKLETQREGVLAAFNAADQEWRQKRYSIGLVVGTLAENDDDVDKAWTATSAAVRQFMDCEQRFALKYLGEDQVASDQLVHSICQAAHKEVDNAQSSLYTALSKVERQYLNPPTSSFFHWPFKKAVTNP